MRSTTPTIHCDAEDCDIWDVDHYEAVASSVDGVRITHAVRSPGWRSDELRDLCPEHAATTEGATR